MCELLQPAPPSKEPLIVSLALAAAPHALAVARRRDDNLGDLNLLVIRATAHPDFCVVQETW